MNPLLLLLIVMFPITPEKPVVDTYHGQEVTDPYRWLEDDRAEETERWVELQNSYTQGYLKAIPGRKAMTSRLEELYNYERFSLPRKKGNTFFYYKNEGLQNRSVIYKSDTPDDEGEVLLNPESLSEDGSVSLRSTSVSDDGSLLAYGISRSGSDWTEWKVRNVQTGEDLPDHLLWSKFSGASWAPDNSGFYYSRYSEPKRGEELTEKNEFHKIYFHRLGTPQSEDQLIYERPDQPQWNLGAYVTEDGQFLFIYVRQGTSPKNGLFYKRLDEPDSEVIELLPDFDASYRYVTHVEEKFLVETDLNAPKGKMIEIDLNNPSRNQWRTLISSEHAIESIDRVGQQLFVTTLEDANHRVHRHTLAGELIDSIDLPDIGSVSGFSGTKEDTETYYSFSSYTTPSRHYRFDLESGESTLFREPKLTFDPDQFLTTQVFATSKDGTRVPTFIVHRKDVKLDGKNPTLLYGYGGFNISLTPGFSPSIISHVERGGLYVVANLRGGAEYGEEWHQEGILENKQNVFDDFIAVAEHLISEGFTRPSQLAIAGGSNGGLLVGACMTQRPELFGACLPSVGVLDMLRYHKFTIGWAWVPEYGSADDPEMFKILKAYSPYHNIEKDQTYPPTMILTGDHDDRVVPAHSFKFAAALQNNGNESNHILLRVETEAGHGAGTALDKTIKEIVDKQLFLERHIFARED